MRLHPAPSVPLLMEGSGVALEGAALQRPESIEEVAGGHAFLTCELELQECQEFALHSYVQMFVFSDTRVVHAPG